MKKDNKGFSLVELIVVVAIMAVLMVVVTPALLRYVEKTRLQRDNSAIAEVANASKIACASETINTEISALSGGTVVSIAADGTLSCDPAAPNFIAELTAAMGKVKLTSNTYSKSGNPTLTVAVDSNMAVTVTGTGVMLEVGGTAGPYTY